MRSTLIFNCLRGRAWKAKVDPSNDKRVRGHAFESTKSRWANIEWDQQWIETLYFSDKLCNWLISELNNQQVSSPTWRRWIYFDSSWIRRLSLNRKLISGEYSKAKASSKTIKAKLWM